MYEHSLNAHSDYGDYHYSGESMILNGVRLPDGKGIKVTFQHNVIVVEIGFWDKGELFCKMDCNSIFPENSRFPENRLANFVRLKIAGRPQL